MIEQLPGCLSHWPGKAQLISDAAAARLGHKLYTAAESDAQTLLLTSDCVKAVHAVVRSECACNLPVYMLYDV